MRRRRKHPGLSQTQDFSPASDCDLAMLKRLINILIRLINILIGAPKDKNLVGGSDAPEEGGAARFLRYVLDYKSLGKRFGIAVVVWIGAWFLGLTTISNVGFLAATIYASLILIRFGAGIAASGNVGHTLNAIWLPVVV